MYSRQSAEHKYKHLTQAGISFILFFLNWISIYGGAVFIFAVKRVKAPKRRAQNGDDVGYVYRQVPTVAPSTRVAPVSRSRPGRGNSIN